MRFIKHMDNKKPGRPVGAQNKFSGQAKENVMAVFTRLGGTQAMAEWATENKTDFYKIYARLLPIDMTGEIAHNYVARTPVVSDGTDKWTETHAPRTH